MREAVMTEGSEWDERIDGEERHDKRTRRRRRRHTEDWKKSEKEAEREKKKGAGMGRNNGGEKLGKVEEFGDNTTTGSFSISFIYLSSTICLSNPFLEVFKVESILSFSILFFCVNHSCTRPNFCLFP